MKTQMTKYPLIAMMTVFLIGGCTPVVNERGNIVQDYQLKQVTPGVHTRMDVLNILGSPTTQAPFDDSLWYYMGQTTEKRGVLDPKVVDERIVAVKFDQEGVVTHVKEVKTDRIDIPIERTKTKTHGSEMTLPQQLLGNLGRYNAPASSGN